MLWVSGILVVLAVVVAVLVRAFFGREVPADRIELPSGSLAGCNVLLVSMDTVRYDRLRCYGYRAIDTPAIDALARRGVRFHQVVTPVPMTLPGHATMLTGLNPQHHGARVNGMFRLNDRVPTLAEVLRQQGYRTGAIIAAFVLDRRFGLNRGFDHYDDDLTTGRSTFDFSYRERPGEQVTDVAAAWLRANAGNRFFLFVHYFDPHWPYAAPEPFGSKYKSNRYGDYDGEIAYTDRQVGRLLEVLDELKLRSRTLIIVTSDHGEGLDEHDEKTHSLLLYDTTLRVPLIFSGPPELPAHRVVTRQVGLVDLMPTVLDLLDVPPPTVMDGISLLKPPPPAPRALYIETLGSKFMRGWAPLVGVRREDYKFVLAPQSELYDLREDPKELKNLYPADHRTTLALHGVLKEMVGGDPELVTEVAANIPVDPETRARLAAVGYVITTTASAPSTGRKTPPDPKEMIMAQRWVHQAETLVHEGQNRKALLLLEPYLDKHPEDAMALNVAGECYRNLGMLDQALETYRRASRLPYERAMNLAGMASVHLLRNELDQAEAACREALDVDSSCLGALLTLGLVRSRQNRDEEAMALFQRVIREGRGTFTASGSLAIAQLHHQRGRPAEARQALDRALAADPTHPDALVMWALLNREEPDKKTLIARLHEAAARRPDPGVLLQLGRLQAEQDQLPQAETSLREALAKETDNAEAHLELARVLQRLGRNDEALTHFREALRLRPNNPEAASELGVALAKQNRLEEARIVLERAAALAPGSPFFRYNLALVLARMNQLDRAVQQFTQAIRLKPDYAEAHYNLGVAYQMLGRHDQAAECFRRAIDLNPKLDPALQEGSPQTDEHASTRSNR